MNYAVSNIRFDYYSTVLTKGTSENYELFIIPPDTQLVEVYI